MHTRILLADDHKIILEGLRSLLREQPDMEVVEEVHDGIAAVRQTEKLRPDIVIMDIGMPDLNGIEAARQIVTRVKGVKVIALSMHSDKRFVLEMLKAGASGYMTKESAPEELVGAVKKAVGGGRYVSAALAEKLASLIVHDTLVAPHERLSDREFLILRMIASGKTVGAIARDLSLSAKTVSTYRARVLEKMCLSNNSELVHYAFQYQLVERRSMEMGPAPSQKQGNTPPPT